MSIRYFGVFDENGFPTAFYNDEIWVVDNMPDGVVEISEKQWKTLIANQGRMRWFGGMLLPFEPPPTPKPAPLTSREKLAAIGITVDDLKALLRE